MVSAKWPFSHSPECATHTRTHLLATSPNWVNIITDSCHATLISGMTAVAAATTAMTASTTKRPLASIAHCAADQKSDGISRLSLSLSMCRTLNSPKTLFYFYFFFVVFRFGVKTQISILLSFSIRTFLIIIPCGQTTTWGSRCHWMELYLFSFIKHLVMRKRFAFFSGTHAHTPSQKRIRDTCLTFLRCTRDEFVAKWAQNGRQPSEN